MLQAKSSRPAPAKKGTLKRLLAYITAEHKYKLVIVLVAMVLSTISNITATYLIQYIIIEAQYLFTIGSTNLTSIVTLILSMVLFYLISIVLAYTYLRIMISIGQDTLVRMRKTMFRHLMSLPLKYFDTHQHGDIMSHFTNDVDATRQMVSQSLPALIISIMTLTGYMVAMFVVSWLLTIITLSVAIVSFIITRYISKKSRKFFMQQQISLGKVNGYIEEMIEGQKIVKVYRHEKVAIKEFNQINEALYQNAKAATIRTAMLIPINVNLGYLGFAIAAVVGAFFIHGNVTGLTVAGLITFLLFVRNFTQPLNQIAQQINFVVIALAGASRIFELQNQIPEENEGKIILVSAEFKNNQLVETQRKTNLWAWKNPKTNQLTQLNGDVRFEHVDFGYNPEKLVLNQISLYAKPGQKIAFVGATGAGKTTITNLINRFYDIQSGKITYDGIDIKDIDKASLRSSLGIVLQDTSLFTGTVLENIRYGRLDATDEEVIKAAQIANAADFISKLPNGYQTLIEDNGANLSQGQRQLISIARAAVANPPVLILDEATASIDTHTEKLIQTGMDQLMEGRTVFVIAHRLSTIKNAKAIIVLDFGNIIERGDHDTLIDYRGKYYQLYTGTFELE